MLEEHVEAFTEHDRLRVEEATKLALTLPLRAPAPQRHARTWITCCARPSTFLNLKASRMRISSVQTLLHDSIEEKESMKKFAELVDGDTGNRTPEEKALAYLDHHFGPRVAKIVDDVTRPKDPNESRDDRNARYAGYVEAVIRNPDAFYVKLVDFYDNVATINEVPDPEGRLRRAKKYEPAFEVFIKRLDEKRNPLALTDERKEAIRAALQAGHALTLAIIAENGP